MLRSSFVVGFLILISRLLGYLRDFVSIMFMGIGISHDIFVIAFRFSNIFRYICGENLFNNLLTPFFSSISKSHKKERLIIIASYIQSIILIVLSCIIVIVFFCIPYFGPLLAPGFYGNSGSLCLLNELVRIMTPYILLVSLSAFYGSILNSYGIFFPHSFAQIVLNLTIVVLFPFLHSFWKTPAHSLSNLIVLGQFLGFLFLFFFVMRNKVCIPIRRPYLNNGVKSLLNKVFFTTTGVSAVSLNIAINTMILSFVPFAISYFYLADRLVQIPLALIGETLTIVFLPLLSKAITQNAKNTADERHILSEMYNYGLRVALFFAIPAIIGLNILSQEIVFILFARSQNFSYTSLYNITLLVKILTIASFGFLFSRYTGIIFYALKNTKIPMFISWIQLCFNVTLSLTFVGKYKHFGVAISIAISALLGAFVYSVVLYRKHGVAINMNSALFIIKSCFCTILMSCFILFTKTAFMQYGFFGLSLLVGLSVVIYFLLSFLLRMHVELRKNVFS